MWYDGMYRCVRYYTNTNDVYSTHFTEDLESAKLFFLRDLLDDLWEERKFGLTMGKFGFYVGLMNEIIEEESFESLKELLEDCSKHFPYDYKATIIKEEE